MSVLRNKLLPLPSYMTQVNFICRQTFYDHHTGHVHLLFNSTTKSCNNKMSVTIITRIVVRIQGASKLKTNATFYTLL